MSDATYAVLLSFLRDLPSTGVLVFFIWLWSKQVTRVLDIAEHMLEQINELIRQLAATPRN